ncbi:MAG: transcription termination factor Rho [Verrucomicrobia bacterium]|nr:transcription termination factor Rho [Verrucomicrobiota bacterium]
MTEPIEKPSLSPEETAPKKTVRRKTPTPRKPRAAKAAKSDDSSEGSTAAPKPAKAAKTTLATRKKTVKKIVAENPAQAPVTEIPSPVAAPVVEPAVVLEPRAEEPAPQAERPPRETREPRGGRGDRGRRSGRSRERQPQGPPPVVPQPPSHAGAVVEEWSPGRTSQTAPAPESQRAPDLERAPVVPPQRQVPATVPNQPEELIIPRRAGQQHMSREERIAAARQQFVSTQARMPEQAQENQPMVDQPRPEPVYAEGIVEVSGKGFGFLRDPKRGYAQHPSDIFVTPEVCRRYNLRDGMSIRGEIRRGNRGPQLYKLTEMEGEDPENFKNLPLFDELTTINPNRFIKLETEPERFTTRVVDLMAPIGRGQRGLIVAPPRTGKTTFLQHIAEAVVKNHPDMKLIILLVDERPEEVTEIKRAVPQAELMASSNDQDIKCHTRIAQLAIERARRLVEMGKHVFILLDSITRVGRAFNNAMAGGGRTMSGGVDARALEIPRKLFASARNTEEAGSLTIIATALIETGSRMDELIFQEFKGTGNMELVLDRKISDLRIYPAVDIFMSGTRREELLLPEADLHKINIIRRGLSGHKPAEAIERLLFFLQKFPTNSQMLREIPG